MEGFLQSLKFKSIKKQQQVCLLTGKDAKNSTKHTFAQLRWKITHNLYWQEKRINRFSDEYQKLLDRAYEALSQNSDFEKALKDLKYKRVSGRVERVADRDVTNTSVTERNALRRYFFTRPENKPSLFFLENSFTFSILSIIFGQKVRMPSVAKKDS